MDECYEHTDIFYWYNKTISTTGVCACMSIKMLTKLVCMYLFVILTGSSKVVDSLCPLVVGHFSVDGSLKEDHYNFKAVHNVIVVDAEPALENLFVQIIEMFSFTGQMVVEAIGTGE